MASVYPAIKCSKEFLGDSWEKASFLSIKSVVCNCGKSVKLLGVDYSKMFLIDFQNS